MAAIDELEALLREAKASLIAIDRVTELIEKKRKLSDSISRRTRELKLTLSIREVDTFVQRLLVVLNEELEAFPEEAERISKRLKDLAGLDEDDEA